MSVHLGRVSGSSLATSGANLVSARTSILLNHRSHATTGHRPTYRAFLGVEKTVSFS